MLQVHKPRHKNHISVYELPEHDLCLGGLYDSNPFLSFIFNPSIKTLPLENKEELAEGNTHQTCWETPQLVR